MDEQSLIFTHVLAGFLRLLLCGHELTTEWQCLGSVAVNRCKATWSVYESTITHPSFTSSTATLTPLAYMAPMKPPCLSTLSKAKRQICPERQPTDFDIALHELGRKSMSFRPIGLRLFVGIPGCARCTDTSQDEGELLALLRKE